MTKRIQRSRDWIEREYGREKWPQALARAESVIASGERSLSRAVARVAAGGRRESALEQREIVVCGQSRLSHAAHAHAGFYGAIAETVAEACTAKTGAVIELAAGWGRNLFNVWMWGGPVDADYVALEFTESGRRCAELLATLEPSLRLTSESFDLASPDLSVVPCGLAHVVVFSVHGIEQVPRVHPSLLASLTRLAKEVTGVHFEPVGWQMPTSVRLATAEGSSREYAERNDYNRDLWAALERTRAEGLIDIESVLPEAQSINPANAVSVVRWRSRTGS